MISTVVSSSRRTRGSLAAAGLVAALSLTAAGCAPGGSSPAAEPPPAPTVERSEIAGQRLAVTYDGGILVLDDGDLDEVAAFELSGFLRLNPAGDQRHLLVSTAQGFQVLDTGVITEGHGDHNHYYGVEPALTPTVYEAPEPGHAVVHHDRIALFSDAAGTVQVVDPERIAEGPAAVERTYTSPTAHHGVAVPLHDGEMLVSVGDSETRVGAQVVDAEGTELARSEECPGIHGEATAGEETVVVGCTDGVLVYADGTFTKVDSPDAYGRIGNQAGSPESPVVLGDYKVDEDAELERPTRVSLIDTEAKTLKLVDLGEVSYSFRSLARGPEGEALVLGTDGRIHVIDPATAKVTSTIPVVEAWKEPMDWQQPRPTIKVDGSVAYVTDPDTSSIHIVSLAEGEVLDTVEVSQVPNEISLV